MKTALGRFSWRKNISSMCPVTILADLPKVISWPTRAKEMAKKSTTTSMTYSGFISVHLLAILMIASFASSTTDPQSLQKILTTNGGPSVASQLFPKDIFIDQLLAASGNLVGANKTLNLENQIKLQHLLNQHQQQAANVTVGRLSKQSNNGHIEAANGTNVPRRAIVSVSSSNEGATLANSSSQRGENDKSTQVNHNFRHNSSLSSVRQKWRQMERSIGDSIQNLARELGETLDDVAPPSISGVCRVALLEFIEALKEQKLWASQMVDASAKLPSGLLEGTLTELGNFDQCLAISYLSETQQASSGELNKQATTAKQNQPSRGQYCSVQIKPHLTPRPRLHTVCQRLPQMSASNNHTSWRLLSQQSHQFHYVGLRLGICTPNKCSRADTQQILSDYLAKYELLGQVKSCQQATTSAQSVSTDQLGYWTTKEVGLDFVQQCIVSSFAGLLVLVAVGTLLDYLCQGSKRRLDGREAQVELGAEEEQARHAKRRHKQVKAESQAKLNQHYDRIAKRCQYQVYRGAFPRCALHQHQLQQARGEMCHFSNSNLDCCTNECESAKLGLKMQKNPLVAHSLNFDEWLQHEGCNTMLSNDSNNVKMLNRPSDDNNNEFEEAWIAQLERNEFADVEAAASKSFLPEEAKQRKRLVERKPVTIAEILSLFLICFSLKKNLQAVGKQVGSSKLAAKCKQTSESKNDMGDIKVIHGLRTLTMVWIIFGHTVGLVSPEMMNNLFSLAQLSCSSRLLQCLLNATLAVNTFFMISGLVTVLSFARKCRSVLPLINTNNKDKYKYKEHKGGRKGRTTYQSEPEVSSSDSSSIVSSLSSSTSSNKCIGERLNALSTTKQPKETQSGSGQGRKKSANQDNESESAALWPKDFQPLLWLLMRYMRLTPAYAAIISASIVLPALGSGPFWQESVGQMGPTCRRNWWINLSYLNNFIETDKLCLIHSWYLSNDWQFFLLTLLLFGLFYKSKKLTLVLIILLIAFSSATTFAISTANDFPPTIVTTSPAVVERWLFIHSLYYKPWPHLSSYLIGLITGYLIVIQDRIHISAVWRFLAWILFSLLAITLLNSIYPWNMGVPVEPLLAGLHSATFRTLWATCCAWLVFALVTKPQTPLAKFLSWQGFQVTSRLTYCAYLVHPLIIYYHFGTLRERLDSSIYGQFHRFMATLGLSYLFALLLSLFVESPSIQLQHYLMKLKYLVLSSDTKGRNSPEEQYEEVGGNNNNNKKKKTKKRTSSATTTTTTHSWSASSSFSEQNSDVSLVANSKPKGDSFEVITLAGPSGLQNKSRAPFSSSLVSKSPLEPRTSQVFHLSAESFLQKSNKSSQPEVGQHQREAADECSSSSISALDADFQQKLAQAISRGFRIRSQIANGTVRKGAASANNRSGLSRRPQSVGLGAGTESRPCFQFEAGPSSQLQVKQRNQCHSSRDKEMSRRELSTFSPSNRQQPQRIGNNNRQQVATSKQQVQDFSTANERRNTHDLNGPIQARSGSQVGHQQQQQQPLIGQNQFTVAGGANLNEIILMKQKLLSSKSHSQIDLERS